MTAPYITQADLEDELSIEVVRQIFADGPSDDANGLAVARFIANAQSIVDSYLRRVYTVPIPAPQPNLVTFLTIEVCAARAQMRHPEYVRGFDGEKRMKAAVEMLEHVATGKMRLDVQGAPEPAANEGGAVVSVAGSDDFPVVRPFVFNAGMGDF